MDDLVQQDFDAAMDFRESLTPETDRGCALMAAAYLDSRLAEWLASYFVADSKAAVAFLGQDKPLSTFSSRIDAAYLLGLITQNERRALHLIRKIRNDFGHIPEPISFDDQRIASRCKNLEAMNFYKRGKHRAMFTGAVMILLASIHARRRTTDHRLPRPEVNLKQGIDQAPDLALLIALGNFVNSAPDENGQAAAQLEAACAALMKKPAGDGQEFAKKIVARIAKRLADTGDSQ